MEPQRILDALRELLSAHGQTHVDLGSVPFVLDENVAYGDTCFVSRSQLVDVDQFDLLAPHLAGGPGWVHANLLLSDAHQHVITIKTGDRVGNPEPTLNVSFEPASVVIMDE
jgi:hypothetical protein